MMDPNATLTQIRRLVLAMHNAPNDDAVVDLGDELRDAVEALDGWLSGGGFPPEAWREGPDAPDAMEWARCEKPHPVIPSPACARCRKYGHVNG